MGFEDAFLMNEQVLLALRIMKSKKGMLSEVKASAKREEITMQLRTSASSSTSQNANPAIGLLGPRGGLPKDKVSLVAIGNSLGLQTDGLAVAQLKELIKPHVQSQATVSLTPTPDVPLAPTGGAPSAPVLVQQGTDTRDPALRKFQRDQLLELLMREALQEGTPPAGWIVPGIAEAQMGLDQSVDVHMRGPTG